MHFLEHDISGLLCVSNAPLCLTLPIDDSCCKHRDNHDSSFSYSSFFDTVLETCQCAGIDFAFANVLMLLYAMP